LGPGVGTYKNFVTARDANSISENPPFLSTTCGNANFLKVNTTIATGTESGGSNIAGITDDFENDIRQGNGGYAGTGTAPDIGADEFGGVPLPLCQGQPAASTINGLAAVCTGSGTTLTLSATYTDIGISYQWQSSTTAGGPYTNMGTASSQATGNLTVPTYYICTISCSFSGQSFTTVEKSVMINPLPNISLTPSTASYCTPGGTPVTLTADRGVTYTYSPTAGLSPTTGAVVSASPSVTTTYTVTGTDANGCVNTASSVISVELLPINVTAAATPSTICPGTFTNLSATGIIPVPASQYAFGFNGAAGSLNPMIGATTVVSSLTDDAPMNTTNGANTIAGLSLPIGFNFNFEGVPYSFFSASPDGWITLKNTNAAATSSFTNTMNLTSNVPKISPYWDDLATGTNGSVQTLVTGSAPNRIFIVQWFVTIPRSTAGVANSTFQAWLYETSGIIEFRYGSMGTATGTVSSGLTGAVSTNLNSITFSTNTASTTANNTQVPGALPTAGTLYSFTPLVPTFSWSPSGDVVDPNMPNTATNPLAATQIFTVTATNGGCSANASVTVTIDPLICLPPTLTGPACEGGNFTITANTQGGGAPYSYSWSDGLGGVYPDAQTITANLPAGNYTFNLLVRDACNSTCTSSITVTVNPRPNVTAATTPANGAICGSGSVELTANGASTYSWSPATGLSSSTGSPVTATPSGSTVYTVTGTDGNGCTKSAVAAVNVGPAVVINGFSPSPAAVCLNGNQTITANAAFNTQAYCASTHANGCSGDEIFLVVLNTLNNPTNNCNTTTAHYNYYNGGGTQTTTLSTLGGPYSLSLTFGTDPNQYFGAWIDYNQDGIFSTSEFLGAAPNAGASGTSSVSFTPPPGALNGKTRLRIVGGNDNPVTSSQACGASSSPWGETQDYDVTITNGVDPFSYVWSPNTFLTSSNTNPVTATGVTATTTYTVTVTSTIGCTSSSTVVLTANNPDDGNVCTADFCDPSSGSVSHTPLTNIGGGDSDGLLCTQDNCLNGVTVHPPALAINCGGTNVICNGANNGTASVTVTTGAGPYTYNQWFPVRLRLILLRTIQFMKKTKATVMHWGQIWL
jgi:hypothetical protein